jgi:hypothetical protein
MDFLNSSSSCELRLGDKEDAMVNLTRFCFLSCVIVDADKSCCHADNKRGNRRTKATSSYVDLVGLKVFSSVELSKRDRQLLRTRSKS